MAGSGSASAETCKTGMSHSPAEGELDPNSNRSSESSDLEPMRIHHRRVPCATTSCLSTR